MKRAALVALAAILLLAGCGSDVTKGEVIAKDFTGAHCETTLVYTGKVFIPITTCYPDEWDLELKDCSSGECKTGWVQVSEAVHDETAIGSRYDSGASS